MAFRQTFLSKSAPVKRGLNLGGPPSKAKYYQVTDSELVPEGKVKSTPEGE